MTIALFLIGYLIGLVWVVLDSRRPGKAAATDRVLAYLWSSTVGALLSFLFVAWWFIRSFIGAFVALVWSDEPISPKRGAADDAKAWSIFPYEQGAFALTGRGNFQWTP